MDSPASVVSPKRPFYTKRFRERFLSGDSYILEFLAGHFGDARTVSEERRADPLFDPFSPEYAQDPYPTYRRLREEDPIHWSPLGFWVLTRFEDVDFVLRDRRFGQDLPHLLTNKYPDRPDILDEASSRTLANLIIMKEPPDHTRIRKLFVHAFNLREVKAMRQGIQGVIDDLLEGLVDKGGMDFVREFAFLLPARVICDWLGFPEEGRDHFFSGLRPPTALLNPLPLDRKGIDEANADILYVREYIKGICDLRRKDPQDDLITALVEAEEDDERLSEDEIIDNAGFLFFAGHETTKNLLANGLLSLHRYPAQLEILKADRSLMKNAVEEFLRFEAPSQMSSARIALEDSSIRDVPIRKGDLVLTIQGAANRDPEVFERPDELDITRRDIKHLSFGGGMHFCLGAHLARLEAEMAFEALLDRLPDLAVDDPEGVTWRPSFNHRSLTRLDVHW